MPRLPVATAALLALGLLVRLVCLGSWGTFDVEVQKAWSARAADDGLADIYGPSDEELLRRARERGGPLLLSLLSLDVPRTEFSWGSASYFVDYPPGSLVLLWGAGKLYAAFDSAMENRRAFNVAINLAPFLGSLAVAWLLWKSAPKHLGSRRALAFWANPAMMLAAPILGYQDTIFGAFALAALLLLMGRRYAWATAFVVVAGLVKPQGALLVPTLALVLFKEAPRAWVRAALAGLGAAALVLAPWWSHGYLLSALDGCRRPLSQPTLAPLGLGVWWAAGWFTDAARHAALPLARIMTIDEFKGATGLNPVNVARALLALATLANMVLLARGVRQARHFIPLSIVLQVHAYALFGTSVHENHTLLAVMVAPLLLGEWTQARKTVALTSAFAFLSLFFAAGLGRHITRQAEIAALKLLTGIDASVLLALAHVALVAALFLWAARDDRAARKGGTVPSRQAPA